MLLRQLDELYLNHPFLGSRRMAAMLGLNRKRIRRLMRIAGVEVLCPKPRLSRPGPGHEIHPYLLRDLVIDRPNQVWSSDITYVPMRRSFLYLLAVMNWFSRYVLSWELSTNMDTGFCLAALEAALGQGAPGSLNTDQGSQFTWAGFTGALRQRQDPDQHGRPRPLDGQRLHRAIVALGEVRTDLHGRFRRRAEIVDGAGKLLPVLQSQPAASGAGLSDARRGVRFEPQGTGDELNLGLRPKSRDLSVSARLAALLLEKPSGCRTIKEPRRKTRAS